MSEPRSHASRDLQLCPCGRQVAHLVMHCPPEPEVAPEPAHLYASMDEILVDLRSSEVDFAVAKEDLRLARIEVKRLEGVVANLAAVPVLAVQLADEVSAAMPSAGGSP